MHIVILIWLVVLLAMIVAGIILRLFFIKRDWVLNRVFLPGCVMLIVLEVACLVEIIADLF